MFDCRRALAWRSWQIRRRTDRLLICRIETDRSNDASVLPINLRIHFPQKGSAVKTMCAVARKSNVRDRREDYVSTSTVIVAIGRGSQFLQMKRPVLIPVTTIFA